MSEATYIKALDFLDRSHIDQVRLLGGEPTLHPEFSTFVDLAVNRGKQLLVFSNGLMPKAALARLRQTRPNTATILVNVTDFPRMKHEDRRHLFDVFQNLRSRVMLGYTIESPDVHLEFMLNLIDEFSLKRKIRLGLAHPSNEYRSNHLHTRYFTIVGQIVFGFMKDAIPAGIKLEFDCGFVPCMFPDEALTAYGIAKSQIGLRCNPIVDILVDGSTVSCFPLAEEYRAPLPQSLDADWLKRQFKDKLASLQSIGIFRECKSCELKREKLCSGGCVASALKRFTHSSPEIEVTHTAFSKKITTPYRKHSTREAVPINNSKETKHSCRTSLWVLPYIDQPLSFWNNIAGQYPGKIKEVYFPLSEDIITSGEPPQPSRYVKTLLKDGPFECSALLNPITLPCPVEELSPKVIETLKEYHGEYGLAGVTVTNLLLASRIRESIPDLSITASVLMDITKPYQANMLNGICDTLVPSSRIMRDLPALQCLSNAFSGRIRLIVNEACLPGCPYRIQHFHEMGNDFFYPQSLCSELLKRMPWLRITGGWVLPQHVHLFAGIFDELKIAGRVTLREPEKYMKVLDAYISQNPLTPDKIGGGPASVLDPIFISEKYYSDTLACNRNCHQCVLCQQYYEAALADL